MKGLGTADRESELETREQYKDSTVVAPIYSLQNVSNLYGVRFFAQFSSFLLE